MFLQILEQLQTAKGDATNEIYIPMDRSDMAECVGRGVLSERVRIQQDAVPGRSNELVRGWVPPINDAGCDLDEFCAKNHR